MAITVDGGTDGRLILDRACQVALIAYPVAPIVRREALLACQMDTWSDLTEHRPVQTECRTERGTRFSECRVALIESRIECQMDWIECQVDRIEGQVGRIEGQVGRIE